MAVRRAELARFRKIEARRVALIERLHRFGDDVLNRAPASGGWSVAQVLSHVTEAESRSLAYIRRRLETPGDLWKAGLAASVRSAALSLALRSPLRFRAPKVVAQVPERRDFDDLEQSWATIRAGWSSLLDEFPESAVTLAVFRHPVAGRMTIGQTLRFVDDHEEHHERQIGRILASHGEEKR